MKKIIVVLVVALLGVVGYFALNKHQSENETNPSASATAEQNNKQQGSAVETHDTQSPKLDAEDILPLEDSLAEPRAIRQTQESLSVADAIDAPNEALFELIFVNTSKQTSVHARQTVQADVELKKVDADQGQIRYLVRLDNIRYRNESTAVKDNEEEQLQPLMVYWTLSDQGEFVDLDLLGLPVESPLTVLPSVFRALGYSIDYAEKTVTIGPVDYQYRYEYDSRDSVIYKNVVSIVKAQDQIGHQIVNAIGKGKFELNDKAFIAEATLLERVDLLVDSEPASVETKVKLSPGTFSPSGLLADTELPDNYNTPADYQPQDDQDTEVVFESDADVLSALSNTENVDLSELQAAVALFSEQGYSSLQQVLLDGTIDEANKSQLIGALQLDGSEASQQLLVGAAQDGALSRNDRIRAIIALGAMEEPSDELVAQVRQLADAGEPTISDNAMLNLGVMASKTDKETGLELANYFADQLGYDEDKDIVLISSIGNSQQVEVYPRLEALLEDSSTSDAVQVEIASVLARSESTAQNLLQNILVPEEYNTDMLIAVNKNIKPQWIQPEILDQIEQVVRTEPGNYVINHERIRLYMKGAGVEGRDIQRRADYIKSMVKDIQGVEIKEDMLQFLDRAHRGELGDAAQ